MARRATPIQGRARPPQGVAPILAPPQSLWRNWLQVQVFTSFGAEIASGDLPKPEPRL